jgi:hypothetical protein
MHSQWIQNCDNQGMISWDITDNDVISGDKTSISQFGFHLVGISDCRKFKILVWDKI